MMAVKTEICANQLPDNLFDVRHAIERAIPHGRSNRCRRGQRDKGSWADIPEDVATGWKQLESSFNYLTEKHPVLKNTNNLHHLGTLGRESLY